jgi:M6 family metalloprotease-like protein
MYLKKLTLVLLFLFIFSIPVFSSGINLFNSNYSTPTFYKLETSFSFSIDKISLVSEENLSLLKEQKIISSENIIKEKEMIDEEIIQEEITNSNHIYETYFSDSVLIGDVYFPEGIIDSSQVRERRNVNSQSTVDNIWGTTPLTGEYNIPVFLVEFSDVPHTLSKEVFEDQFNSPLYLDGNGTSVSQYYKKQSYGELDITFDVYDWREMPETHEFYINNTGNMLFHHHALALFGTGPDAIDLTQYDSDNDGRIDGFVIVHAGYSLQNAGAGHLRTSTVIMANSTSSSIQGLYYGNIAVTSERYPSCSSGFNENLIPYPDDCRIGVLDQTHEFGHILGLPDFYGIDPNTGGQSPGLQNLTMMMMYPDIPQKPINLDAWARYFLGWIQPTTIEEGMQGVYPVYSIDTNPDGAFILQDLTEMDSREFFIIENRFMQNSPYNQDTFLLNTAQLNWDYLDGHFGGIAIYHVDEQYIEDNYPTNSIMWDPDGDFYDDTGGHPGIVFEENIKFSENNWQYSLGDLYSSERNDGFGDNTFGHFDRYQRFYPEYNILWDYHNKAYNGNLTGVTVGTLSGSGSIVYAYLQSYQEPFDALISSPKNNRWYKYTNNLNFISSYYNNLGDVSCVWEDSSKNILSQDCEFSATPEELDLPISECSEKITLTLEITDQETGDTIIDTVDVKIYETIRDICETANNTTQAATE